MGLRVQPDNGPLVEFLPGGSSLTSGEDPIDLIKSAVARLRVSNKISPARPKSTAITKCDEALLWLQAFERGEVK